MSLDNESRLRFRFSIANKEAENLKRLIRQLQQDIAIFERQDREIAGAAKQASSGIDLQNKALLKAAKATQRAIREQREFEQQARRTAAAVDDQRSSLDRANDEFNRVSRQVGLAGDVQSNVGALRGLAGAAGATGVATGLDIGTEVVVLAEELPRLKASLAGMPEVARAAAASMGLTVTQMGLLGAAAAAIGFVVIQLVKDIQAERERAKEAGRLSAEFSKTEAGLFAETQELIRTGNTELAQERLDNLEIERRTLADEMDFLAARRGELETALSEIERGVNESPKDFENRRRALQSELDTINEALQETTLELGVTLQAHEAYSEVLTKLPPIIDDNEEAEKRLAEIRQFTSALLDDQFAVERRISGLQGQKSDALQDQLESSRQEVEFLQREIEARQAVGLEVESLQRALNRETQIVSFLESGIIASTRAREQEAAAAERAAEARADTTQRLEQLQALNQQIIDAQQNMDAAINTIQQDLFRETSELAAERSQELAEAEREAATERSEAVREANQERIDLEEEHQDRINQINRRANSTMLTALANRDAVAFFMAQRAREEQLAEEEDNFRDRNDELEQQLNEQLRTIERSLSEQRREVEQSYQEQLADAQQAAAEQVANEQQKFRQLVATQQQAAQQIIAQAQDTAALREQIERQGANAALSASQQFWNGVLQQATAALAAIRASRPPPVPVTTSPNVNGTSIQGPSLSAFQHGGFAHGGQDILVGERGPEILRLRQPANIFNASTTRRMMAGSGAGGGININIPVDASGRGMGRRQILNAVTRELSKKLSQAGID